MIFYNTLTPIVYTSVKESGIQLSARFLCEPQKRRVMEDLIWQEVLVSFKKASNIELAYPTVRFFQTK